MLKSVILRFSRLLHKRGHWLTSVTLGIIYFYNFCNSGDISDIILSFTNIFLNICDFENLSIYLGFPKWLSSKESAFNAGNAGDTGDADSIPASGRSPGEGNGH